MKFLCEAHGLFLGWGFTTHQLLFELLEEPILIAAMGNFKEITAELGQFAGAKVAPFQESVTFEEVRALAKNFTRCHIVLHNSWHTEALNGAYLHADGTTVVAGHNWPAAFVDELVFLKPRHHTLSRTSARPGQRFTQTWHSWQN